MKTNDAVLQDLRDAFRRKEKKQNLRNAVAALKLAVTFLYLSL